MPTDMICPRCHQHPATPPCAVCQGSGSIPDKRLSRHFMLSEMLRSDAALRRGFANDPSEKQLANLQRLCVELLDPVADHFCGLIISSGYRSPQVNIVIGGSSTSSHCAEGDAAAADTEPVTNAATLAEIIVWAKDSGLAFDQIIYEYGRWVHFSDRNAAGQQRRMVLMKFAGSGYLPFDPTDARVH